MITRKTYRSLASALNSAIESVPTREEAAAIVDAAQKLCPALYEDNAKFDRHIFMEWVTRGTKMEGVA
mgnify:FL=1